MEDEKDGKITAFIFPCHIVPSNSAYALASGWQCCSIACEEIVVKEDA